MNVMRGMRCAPLNPQPFVRAKNMNKDKENHVPRMVNKQQQAAAAARVASSVGPKEQCCFSCNCRVRWRASLLHLAAPLGGSQINFNPFATISTPLVPWNV